MPDVPQDPRQLARDILSGKIKIEDLARQRQQQANRPVPPPQQKPIQQIPLPRQAPPPPQRPVARPQNVPQPPKRTPPPPPKQQQPKRPPAPPSQLPQPAKAVLEAVAEPYDQAPKRSRLAPAASAPLRQQLQSPTSLRNAILLSEILGKPLSLRD